jgi:hypothetical protein
MDEEGDWAGSKIKNYDTNAIVTTKEGFKFHLV